MLDTTPLLDAADHFAAALRAAPQSRLQRGAAAEGLALARELALRAQRIETPEREPRTMPDAGVFVVADQVQVAGRDLAEALRKGSAAEVSAVTEAVSAIRAAERRAFP
ncbi:hypothetical protein [Streptomyces sp. NPDC048057]|uniref:hypothetical protein n=1 Tax=Streptomyces sp. NPDC048057 TaxID=3155628 RepID=UPI0033C61B64